MKISKKPIKIIETVYKKKKKKSNTVDNRKIQIIKKKPSN